MTTQFGKRHFARALGIVVNVNCFEEIGFTVSHYVVAGRNLIKVIRKFFLKHNKSFRWHLGDYEKHIFFPFEDL